MVRSELKKRKILSLYKGSTSVKGVVELEAHLRRLSIILVTATAAGGLLAEPTWAFGRDDRWESGWGQGVSEAIVTHGPGNQIYVTCNDGGSSFSHTGISFMLGGRSPTGSSITLTFDNEDPLPVWITDGEITSDCRACAGNYEYIVTKMKAHSSVHVLFESGNAARFTLKNSSNAIAPCTPDFAR